jgi:hypothetical protein
MGLNQAKLIGGIFGIAAVIVAIGMLAGGAASATPALSPVNGLGSAGPAVNTSQNFSFSATHPLWNSGNLCTPVTVGSVETCTYSGGSGHGFAPSHSNCGCRTVPPLTYNFSGANLHFVVNLSNLRNQPVYLNFVGVGDTIQIDLTGCQGGTLNVSVLAQTTVTFTSTASSVKAWIYLYSDADRYVANLSGGHTAVWTYFVSARPKYNECPAANNTKTDSYALNVTGKGDYQGLVFVNGVGYSTATNYLNTGNGNSVSFENTTNFECSWSNAPASTCHSGWGPAFEGAAVRTEE